MVNAWFIVLLWINLAGYFRHVNLIRQTHYPDERHYIFLISLTRIYRTNKTQNSCQDKVYLRSSIRANQRRLKRNEETPSGSQGGSSMLVFSSWCLNLWYESTSRRRRGRRHTAACGILVPAFLEQFLDSNGRKCRHKLSCSPINLSACSHGQRRGRQSPGTRRSLSFMI